MASRLSLIAALLLLVACSSPLVFWGNTPSYVRNQLDAADRLLARGDTADARARFDLAAETGHPEALIRAGRAWLADPDPDPVRAQALFELAWTRNSARRDQAGVLLARTIADAEPARAIAILEAVVARGEPRAARELATLLEQAAPEDPRIEGLLRQAAAESDVSALLTLAHDYGDEAAALQAVALLEDRHRAADPYAANHLARLYRADGPLPNPALEVTWLGRAAERGHPAAMLNFGRALLVGQVIERDPARGLAWVRRAAEADNPWAQLELGRRLTRGDDVAPDPVEGRAWLEKAAGLGNQAAARTLADL